MKRTTPLRRRTPLRKRNARRLRRLREVAFGEQADRCRRSRCIACALLCKQQTSPTDPHHDPCRPKGTDRDTIPLCRDHHTGRRGVHTLGRETFWRIVGIEVEVVLRWMREPGTVIDAHWSVLDQNDSPVSLSLSMVAWR